MNKSIVLLIALLTTSLSGCLGIPEGAIAPGDTVQVVLDIYDADTDEPLVTNTAASFIIGRGDAGYGYEFERQLIAKPTDFEGTLTIRGDSSVEWSEMVSVQARYTTDLVQTVPIEQFEPSFGTPVEGETFSPPGAFFDYLILDVDAGLVAFQPQPEQGQRDPVPVVAAYLVTSIEGDQLVQVLEPDVGATFLVRPPNQFNPTTPLGLAPGSYRAHSGDGETITYERSAVSNPDIAGHDLRIEVRVTGVTKSTQPTSVDPVDGNYGVRQSPVVNGAPSPVVDFGPVSDAATESSDDDHDHGHEDDGHTH